MAEIYVGPVYSFDQNLPVVDVDEDEPLHEREDTLLFRTGAAAGRVVIYASHILSNIVTQNLFKGSYGCFDGKVTLVALAVIFGVLITGGAIALGNAPVVCGIAIGVISVAMLCVLLYLLKTVSSDFANGWRDAADEIRRHNYEQIP